MCEFCNNIYDSSKPTVVKVTTQKPLRLSSHYIELDNPYPENNPKYVAPEDYTIRTFLDYEHDEVFLVTDSYGFESNINFVPISHCPECGTKFILEG